MMKSRYIFAAIFILVGSMPLYSQKEITAAAFQLIRAKEFDMADQYLDSILKADPKCVDAIMMKGNVIINRAVSDQPEVLLSSDENESIFDDQIGSIGNNPISVDIKDAKKVQALWEKCLQIDPGRTDIHMGLCTLYGMALMKDELLAELPKLVAAKKERSDQMAYDMENYAQAFMQRHDEDGCMEVYKKITELFPACGGIMGDMAVMYQKNGKMKEAVACSRRASKMKGNDFITDYNTAGIISIADNIEDGCKILMAAEGNDPVISYYQGIIRFYHNDPAWRKSIKDFISHQNSEKDDPRLAVAKIMASPDFKFDSAGYMSVMAIEPYEFEYLLFSDKAKKELDQKYVPVMKLSRLYASKSCYTKSLESLATISKLHLGPIQDSTYHFYLGYSQYKSGALPESIHSWEMLIGSSDFFRQSAACYFLGSIYLKQSKKDKAKELFAIVSERPSESKFANMCRARLDAMNK